MILKCFSVNILEFYEIGILCYNCVKLNEGHIHPRKELKFHEDPKKQAKLKHTKSTNKVFEY